MEHEVIFVGLDVAPVDGLARVCVLAQELKLGIAKCCEVDVRQYSVFSNFSATVTVSPSGPPGLFKGVTTAMSGVLARFPWLLPVRNPVAGYGAPVPRTMERGQNTAKF